MEANHHHSISSLPSMAQLGFQPLLTCVECVHVTPPSLPTPPPSFTNPLFALHLLFCYPRLPALPLHCHAICCPMPPGHHSFCQFRLSSPRFIINATTTATTIASFFFLLFLFFFVFRNPGGSCSSVFLIKKTNATDGYALFLPPGWRHMAVILLPLLLPTSVCCGPGTTYCNCPSDHPSTKCINTRMGQVSYDGPFCHVGWPGISACKSKCGVGVVPGASYSIQAPFDGVQRCTAHGFAMPLSKISNC
mmetsp:Transcript_35928/g.64261  ORF Transcript_35928/g.64261 Transcript_35928/m.64261 type:complete len:249 (-) Transcript_35928:4206-4952(-)